MTHDTRRTEMGRSYDTPRVEYSKKYLGYVIARTRDPDDEFAEVQYMDEDFNFTVILSTPQVWGFEWQAAMVRAAWLAGRDSVTVSYD